MALLALFLIFALPILLLYFLKPSSPKNLPPGPFSWPLLGTLGLKSNEKQAHVVLTNLAQTYGPLMLLKLGVKPVIVASTHDAAMEILKTQDHVLSGRCPPHSVQVEDYIEASVVWADRNEHWKMVRKICRTELFSTKMLESQASIREERVSELIAFLRRREGEVVKISDVIFGCMINVLGSVIFNQSVYDFEGKKDTGMKGMIRELMILAATPNLPDFYPIFDRFDIQGLRRTTSACWKRMSESWAGIVKERRASRDHSRNDFLDVLIQANFTDPQIDALFLEIFAPGSDSTTTAMEWAMTELMRNPEKRLKVQNELKTVIGNRQVVKESDLPNLPYLHACVKESLRLHPPVTFLLPHKATETCQVMNYTIPKGTQLMVNAYAIGRDPKTWDDPLCFKPERFLNSEVDYQGNDFNLIPFGSGRRMCIGMPLASRVVRLIIASLIHNFDWSLPGGIKPSELDMQEMFELVLQKHVPLSIIPNARA